MPSVSAQTGKRQELLDASPPTGYSQAMKAANHSPRRRKVNLRSDSFSLSDAKTYLGRLLEKASMGQRVCIARGLNRNAVVEQSPGVCV